MKIIFLGNFRLSGTGYTVILSELALGLAQRGHEVMVLGIGYDGREHDFPFKLVPIEEEWSFEALRVLPGEWRADRVVVALDVPYLTQVAKKFIKEGYQSNLWSFEALFPIESHPILKEWRTALAQFKQRFVISQYGQQTCEAGGLPSLYLPMGCHVGRMPKSKESPRKVLGWSPDETIFLTVAANHERKAFPLALRAFSTLPDDTHYYIVTDPQSRLGWELGELADEYGVLDRFNVVQHGVPKGILSAMYWAADALVVPSQAEGACLPIYEAAQHGLPVIAGEWTALRDVMDEYWVLSVRAEYEHRFPWGNVNRWFASVDDLADRMMQVYRRSVPLDQMSEMALEFARARPWSLAVDVLEGAGAPVTQPAVPQEVEA